MTKANSVYGDDLASDKTYDLTSQPHDLSRVGSQDARQVSAPRLSRPDVARLIIDPEPRRRALRFGLLMVVGRDEGPLASPSRAIRRK